LTDESSPNLLAAFVSKFSASFVVVSWYSLAIDRARESSAGEMAPSAAAARNDQNVLSVNSLIRQILPVVCKRMPRSDRGRGSCRRHVDNVHMVWRMSSKTCRPSAFVLRTFHMLLRISWQVATTTLLRFCDSCNIVDILSKLSRTT